MILRLWVQPRARKNRLGEQVQEEWKLYLAAPPVEGKANTACKDFLARGLGIARSRIRLVTGEKSRHKVLELQEVSDEDFLRFVAATRG